MSEKYAVIQISGHQYLVSEGDVFDINRPLVKEGEKPAKLEPKVLMYFDGKKYDVGTPTVSAVKVKLDIENEFNDKIHVRRYKSKSRYRRKSGYKYPMARVNVVSISEGEPKIKAEKAEDKLKAKKTTSTKTKKEDK